MIELIKFSTESFGNYALTLIFIFLVCALVGGTVNTIVDNYFKHKRKLWAEALEKLFLTVVLYKTGKLGQAADFPATGAGAEEKIENKAE